MLIVFSSTSDFQPKLDVISRQGVCLIVEQEFVNCALSGYPYLLTSMQARSDVDHLDAYALQSRSNNLHCDFTSN